MNSHIDEASDRATGSGLAIARFFGASSPKTICATVARISASVSEIPKVTDSGTPTAINAGSITEAIAGSAMKPTSSVVTVIPSCAPESMKLRRLCTSIARLERRSPSSTCSRSRLRRAATNANSTATKYPLAAMSATTPNNPRAVSTASTSFSVDGHGCANVIDRHAPLR